MLFNNKKNSKDKKKGVSKKQQNKIKKTVQQTVPYYAVYPEGIIETEPGVLTKTYKLQDVNYQTAKYEDKQDMFFIQSNGLIGINGESYENISNETLQIIKRCLFE